MRNASTCFFITQKDNAITPQVVYISNVRRIGEKIYNSRHLLLLVRYNSTAR